MRLLKKPGGGVERGRRKTEMAPSPTTDTQVPTRPQRPQSSAPTGYCASAFEGEDFPQNLQSRRWARGQHSLHHDGALPISVVSVHSVDLDVADLFVQSAGSFIGRSKGQPHMMRPQGLLTCGQQPSADPGAPKVGVDPNRGDPPHVLPASRVTNHKPDHLPIHARLKPHRFGKRQGGKNIDPRPSIVPEAEPLQGHDSPKIAPGGRKDGDPFF